MYVAPNSLPPVQLSYLRSSFTKMVSMLKLEERTCDPLDGDSLAHAPTMESDRNIQTKTLKYMFKLKLKNQTYLFL